MKVIVKEHELQLDETPVNELEVNITKVQFEFPSAMENLVKEAYFTLDDNTYKVIIENNECNIPNEVLVKKGTITLGVVAFEVENETTLTRYNPSPLSFDTWSGSLKQADNSEPITPTDKEQIEQELLNISNQMDNLDIEAEKEEHTTTITITRKDGTTESVQVLDGEQGPQGEQGPAGSIKIIVVETLPTQDIDTSAIYLVPSQETESQNNYEEYVYINNQWEKLGEVPIATDLTDYVKNTDYATNNVGGVIKTNSNYGTTMINGYLGGDERSFAGYNQMTNYGLIGKGTLENVITGKGLVSNTNYATQSTGGVVKVNTSSYATDMANGYLVALPKTYAQYGDLQNYAFISKGTLENVLTNRIGAIDSVLDAINGEVI